MKEEFKLCTKTSEMVYWELITRPSSVPGWHTGVCLQDSSSGILATLTIINNFISFAIALKLDILFGSTRGNTGMFPK